MKVYDAAAIRNVAVVGHGGCGKTQLVSAMLFVGRRGQPARQGRRRHDRHRLRRRRNRPQAHPLLQPRLRRVAEDQDQHHRHARLRQLPQRRASPRCASPKARWSCVDAVAGVEVQTEKLWAEAASPRPSAHRRRQPAGTRAREPRAHARVAAPRLRARDRPDPAPDRRGARLHRRRRPRAHEGADVCRRRQRQDDRGRRARGAGRPRDAARAKQLIEMVAEADEQLMETFFAEGTLTQEQLAQGLRAATMAGKIFPLVCTSGLHAIGIQPLLDAIVSYVPSPAEREFPALTPSGDADGDQGVRHRALRRVRLEDDRRSVRRPHHDAARRRGHAQAGHATSTTRRATAPSGSATCWRCRARRRRRCPS